MHEVKHYRVRANTPLWKQGAIISNLDDQDEYVGITPVWDTVDLEDEYLSACIIEKQPEWFEQVEPALGANNELTFTKV